MHFCTLLRLSSAAHVVNRLTLRCTNLIHDCCASASCRIIALKRCQDCLLHRRGRWRTHLRDCTEWHPKRRPRVQRLDEGCVREEAGVGVYSLYDSELPPCARDVIADSDARVCGVKRSRKRRRWRRRMLATLSAFTRLGEVEPRPERPLTTLCVVHLILRQQSMQARYCEPPNSAEIRVDRGRR